MSHEINFTEGERYGYLSYIKELPRKKGKRQALFLCECGQAHITNPLLVRKYKVVSCGCLQKFLATLRGSTHGLMGTPEYYSWQSMRTRCNNKNRDHYKNYGGRGITVCKRWDKFENFLEDMGERTKGTTIDRIDNNGGYCKENCRWSTSNQQARNKTNSKIITINGESKNLIDWANEYNISESVMSQRVKIGDTGERLIRPIKK